jgi:hypothetical protein
VEEEGTNNRKIYDWKEGERKGRRMRGILESLLNVRWFTSSMISPSNLVVVGANVDDGGSDRGIGGSGGSDGGGGSGRHGTNNGKFKPTDSGSGPEQEMGCEERVAEKG